MSDDLYPYEVVSFKDLPIALFRHASEAYRYAEFTNAHLGEPEKKFGVIPRRRSDQKRITDKETWEKAFQRSIKEGVPRFGALGHGARILETEDHERA